MCSRRLLPPALVLALVLVVGRTATPATAAPPPAPKVEARTAVPPTPFGKPGWMDSALLAAAGTPSVVFGPGGEGAHALVEWVDLDDVAACVDIYHAVAHAICG